MCPSKDVLGRVLVALVLQLAAVAAARSQTAAPLPSGALPTAANLLPDPGFERPVTAWPLMEGFSIDAATAHAVAHSLRRTVGPTTPYAWAIAHPPLEAGASYLVRAWVRTEGLVMVRDVPGWEAGASWYVEWWQGGAYIGGHYPTGVLGTRDWTLVEDVLHVPAGLPAGTSFSFGLYTREGLEGTAWFDDVEMYRSLVEPVGFEGGPEPYPLNPEFTHDTRHAFRGTDSLQVSRPSAGTACRGEGVIYHPNSVAVPLEPGGHYRAVARVLTDGITVGQPCGGPTGASVYFESYDAGGWVGGSYPPGAFEGTGGTWRRVEAEYRVPPAASRSYLGLYIALGQEGTAWFDEVVAVPATATPLSVGLSRPAYRGTLYPGGAVEVTATADPAGARLDPADLGLRATLRRTGDGTVLSSLTFAPPLSAFLRFRLSSAGAQPGEDLEVEVAAALRSSGEVVQLERRPLHVATAAEAAAAVVRPDDRSFLTRNGQPFFPVGIYTGACDHETLDLLEGTAVDALLFYGFREGLVGAPGSRLDRMEACLAELELRGQRRGRPLYAIPSLADVFPFADCEDPIRYGTPEACRAVPGCQWGVSCYNACWNSNGATECEPEPPGDSQRVLQELVARLAGHESLLAWYIQDEPRPEWREVVERKYRTLRALDPAHPVLLVAFHEDWMAPFEHAADIFGTDSYPVPGNVPSWDEPAETCVGPSPLRKAGELLDRSRPAVHWQGVPFVVPQLHGLWNYPYLLPCGWSDPDRDGHPDRNERQAAWPSPTEGQAIYLAFDPLVRGARGSVFYSLFDVRDEDRFFDPDRWPWIVRLFANLKAVGTAAALGDDLGSVGGATGVGLRSRAWKRDQDVYLVVANDGPGDQPSLRLRLPYEPGGPVRDLSTGEILPVQTEGGDGVDVAALRLLKRAPVEDTFVTLPVPAERARVLHYRLPDPPCTGRACL